MFIYQTMFVVTNNEDETEKAYEYIHEARQRLVMLCDSGYDAQMFPVRTVKTVKK